MRRVGSSLLGLDGHGGGGDGDAGQPHPQEEEPPDVDPGAHRHRSRAFPESYQYEEQDSSSHRRELTSVPSMVASAVAATAHIMSGMAVIDEEEGGLRQRRGRRRRHHHRRKHRKDEGEDGEKRRRRKRDNKDKSGGGGAVFTVGHDDDDEDEDEEEELFPWLKDGGERKRKPIFAEMEELMLNRSGQMEWKETARWLKFEEDVESGGDRWSKPHVGTLLLRFVNKLIALLGTCNLLLDMEANTQENIYDLALDAAVNSGSLPLSKRNLVRDALMRRHRHQNQAHHRHHHHHGHHHHHLAEGGASFAGQMVRSLADIGRWASFGNASDRGSNSADEGGANLGYGVSHPNFNRTDSTVGGDGGDSSNGNSVPGTPINHGKTSRLMRKMKKETEAANVLVGELEGLDEPFCCFIRLSNSVHLGDLTEVPLATKFIFVYVGPPDADPDEDSYHEVGRCMSTLLSDEIFQEFAYGAKNRAHILSGVKEFVDSSTVLPPGEWDPTIRIEPPPQVPQRNLPTSKSMANTATDAAGNKKTKKALKATIIADLAKSEAEQQLEDWTNSGLVFSKRPFKGLADDVKRKMGHYLADFVDGVNNIQCLASMIFIYFAVLAPVITFGGLLGDATGGRVSVIEALLGQCLVGVAYALFSGQPLSIIGATGPILIFEGILFQICSGVGLLYLPFRACVGLWMSLFLVTSSAFNLSAAVRYITRFTEENFALFIAFIFVAGAFEKLAGILHEFPMEPDKQCVCAGVLAHGAGSWHGFPGVERDADFCANINATRQTEEFEEDSDCHYAPNVFMTSVVLFFGTFILATSLKKFRTAPYFPARVRAVVSDFAVVIALLSMTALNAILAVNTPRLQVPSTVTPSTSEGRLGWLVDPVSSNPWWSPLAASIPALLGTILVYMDQQITVVIVNRKENKLKKGCGYHLDLLIVGLLVGVCSLLGFPWCEASTVPSITHVNSLRKESEGAAPGEKPQFLGVREQRVTALVAFALFGLSAFAAPALSTIPMPVLYGVFLFMGISSLNGIQFFDRLCLFLMPVKHQPDYPYLRRVPLRRVHYFTLVQLGCLMALIVVQEVKSIPNYIRVFLPVMLVVTIGVRKWMDRFFSSSDLRILDDVFPSFKRSQHLDQEDQDKVDEEEGLGVINEAAEEDEKEKLDFTLTAGSNEELALTETSSATLVSNNDNKDVKDHQV